MSTALFGEKKFGTFQFGPTVQTRPRLALEIDWDMNGVFSGRNDGQYLSALTIERGRRYTIRADGNGFEENDTGKLLATLVDLNRDYDPYFTSSPLYPNVGPGRIFRLRVRTPNDQIYHLMAGMLGEPVIGLDENLLTVSLSGTDGWGYLRDQKSRISIPLQENVYCDTALQLILDAIAWPALWGSSLGAGVERHPYWWINDQSAAAAVHDLTFSELGRVYLDGAGALTFRSRHTIESATITISKEDILSGTLNIQEPWEAVRNSVQVIAAPRSEQPVGELWRLPQAIRVNANSSVEIFIDYTFNNEKCPARNVLQPVPFTDYLADTESTGGGTDLTASFSVTADVFSTGAKLTIRNDGAMIGWLWTGSLRGNAIAASNKVKYQVDDPASQALLKVTRSFTLQTDWMQNINSAQAAARYLGSILPQSRKYLSFDLVPNAELQFSLDLDMLVNVYLPDDGIDATYRVHYLRHEFMDVAGLQTRTTVMAEPYAAPDTDYWILPKQIPMKVAY